MSFAAVKVGNRPAQLGGKALESSPQRSLFKINLPGVTRFLVCAQGTKKKAGGILGSPGEVSRMAPGDTAVTSGCSPTRREQRKEPHFTFQCKDLGIWVRIR